MRIQVMGVKGRVGDVSEFIGRAGRLEKSHSSTIQFFRADRVFGAEHLLSAAEKAVRSFANGTNMSKTLGMEILMYAAAERQTTGALRKMGMFDGISEMGLVLVGEMPAEELLREMGLERDDGVLDPAGKDPTIFGIRPAELNIIGEARLAELVLERVAMSEVER